MKKQKIVIIFMCKVDDKVILEIKEHIKKIYGLETEVIFYEQDLNYAYNNQRNQYLAEDIIQEVRKIKKKEYEKWLLIVDVDLYTLDSDFVFGLACSNDGISILSINRLKHRFYSLEENERIFITRLKKVATHEIGHLFNLDEFCHSKKCVMQCSYPLDLRDSYLCESCKRFLYYRLKGYKYSLLLYTLWHA
ncbi:MAG: archaemetzincin family Zn-dependent metalloprotease [Thermodesulfovibrio sp.]|nr:archaemetzincin family Zn-dependent metalloprotease [Thermodesulfovibrio sp.]